MYSMKFKLELDTIIECIELLTDEQYEEYKHVLNFLDPESNSYFSSFGDWNINLKGFLKHLEFKKIADYECEILKSVMGTNECIGVKIYNKLNKLRESYKPNNSHPHNYILSKLSPKGSNSYYRLYKKFELKVFEYEHNGLEYSSDNFITDSTEVWVDEYMFSKFSNEHDDIVEYVKEFGSVDELVSFLNKNNIKL